MSKRTVSEKIDLNGGFYTVSEAVRLIGTDAQRVVRWFQPTPSGNEPIILREYQKLGREHELSFLDLLEVRFVEHFRKHVSLQALRVAAKNARHELGVSHPFATSNVKFQTDKRQIFLESAKETGDTFLLNLMTNQIEIYEFMEQALARDLEFDVSGMARVWHPTPNTSPNVLVSPAFAFGQPVISDRHIPTATLFRTWKAEDGATEAVAEWHSVTTEDVRQAVLFEMRTLH
ncbi:DUF433 domain-containing protein [Brevundimonas sp.]|jgi:uncharacterized protein (DUF433 family)|uniref:DUF433 domain-containing protein n=1 Tax=Brevundimonas sp. TaxID=1871086 RepID=UPI003784AF55